MWTKLNRKERKDTSTQRPISPFRKRTCAPQVEIRKVERTLN